MKDYKKEIKGIYKDYCKELKIKSAEEDFKDFLGFLEIDFYDWIKENLKSYFNDRIC